MAFASNTLDFVRGFFKEQDYKRPPFVPVVGYGGMTTTSPYFSYGLPSGTMSGLTDYLRIDAELVSRFIDYEDCDDSPLVASALDVYSDESTQVDSQTGFSVNIKCENEAIRQSLHELFHKRLRIEESIWQHVRLLCKYGNNYSELVAKDQIGVIALNALPAPTVRRIELPKQIGMGMSFSEAADTLGFLYDPTGLFKITTQEFIQELGKRSGSSDGMKETSQEGRQTGCVTFEGWEIMHMRLLGKSPNSIYGFCLDGDTYVFGPSGRKKIKDITAGEFVWTWDGKNFVSAKVKNKFEPLTKNSLKISTRYRDVIASVDHPFLTRLGKWKRADELSDSDELCIISSFNGKDSTDFIKSTIDKLESSKDSYVSVVGETLDKLLSMRDPRGTVLSHDAMGFVTVGKNESSRIDRVRGIFGYSRASIDDFLSGKQGMRVSHAVEVLQTLGLSNFEKDLKKSYNRESAPISFNISSEDFFELFGFMLGDGFFSANGMSLALGVHDELNRRYIELIESFGVSGHTILDSYDKKTPHIFTVNNLKLKKMFEDFGFIQGAKNKRIPSWVFHGSIDERKAFLNGFINADGWITSRAGNEYFQTELCNFELCSDLKYLAESIGYTCGKVRSRVGRVAKLKRRDGTYQTVKSGESYLLFINPNKQRDHMSFERVTSVESCGEREVFDIEMDHESHNFIANGIVVHNSVTEPARWIFKRLMLLEDSIILHRLTRAPSRYAFYVDVSQIPPNETTAYLNKVKQSIKKQKFVNPNGNKMDQKYSVLSSDDDFFLPTREGRESTRVESLAGPVYDHIEDIRFFENKLFAALKVPKPFLTYEETTAKTHLSAEDARFARTIIRIQREVRNGLRKVARVHLAAIGINPDSVDFDITMTIPSAIFELAQLEIRSAELDLAEKFSAWADRDWIMHNILNFSDQQISEMNKKKQQDEMAGEEPPKGSASGDLDKALSKRGQQVLPSKAPENASKVYRKGILVNSKRRKNTEYLKERIEEQRTKDPVFDQRWSEITGLMSDLKDALGK